MHMVIIIIKLAKRVFIVCIVWWRCYAKINKEKLIWNQSSVPSFPQGHLNTSPTSAVHPGTLCKSNMAAACTRALCKVGGGILESPAARRFGTVSSFLVGNVCSRGSGRAYGTGGDRSHRLSSPRTGAAGGRVLGCAVLLGGGLGLYHAVKFRLQRHLAEEETKVSPPSGASNAATPRAGIPLVSGSGAPLLPNSCRQGHRNLVLHLLSVSPALLSLLKYRGSSIYIVCNIFLVYNKRYKLRFTPLIDSTALFTLYY